MTPGKAIRKVCVECVGSIYEVRHCGGDKMLGQGDKNGQCWLYPYRLGSGRPSVRRIRKHCLECMAGSYKLVAKCRSYNCHLHQFRYGKNPNYGHKKSMRKKLLRGEF